MPEIFQCGPAALISALYDELKIGQTIVEMVRWDDTQCRISPGKRIKAIVINIFGRRRPLYRIDEFYERMDTENLFGRGIRLKNLTDYNLTRALDKLAERGPHELFSTLCLRAICSEQIALKYLYSDTTSILVHGDYEYEEATDPDFFITYGHSKNKRPDLKQLLYGLSVTEDKVPVAAEVNSGNLDDKSWNFDYIEKLAATLTPEKLAEVIYVADSAIVTEANLEKLQSHNLKFISRLPGIVISFIYGTGSSMLGLRDNPASIYWENAGEASLAHALKIRSPFTIQKIHPLRERARVNVVFHWRGCLFEEDDGVASPL